MSAIQSTKTKNPDWSEIGEYIAEALLHLRATSGLSQAAISDRLSKLVGEPIRQGYISRIENKVCGMTLKRLGHFASVYECAPSDILRIAEDIHRNSSESASTHHSAIYDDLVLDASPEDRKRLLAKPKRKQSNPTSVVKKVRRVGTV